MGPVVEFLIVSTVGLLNFIDKCLHSLFGIKLLRIDEGSMMNRLSPEQREEARSGDIAKPLELFLRGVGAEPKLDFWRRVEVNKLIQMTLENRISIRNALQENPGILTVSCNNFKIHDHSLEGPLPRPD